MTSEVRGAAARIRSLIALQRNEEAVEVARTAVAADPQSFDLVQLLATALNECERYKEALEVAEQAVALQPDDARGHELRGWALHKLGRCKEGAAALRHAIELDPVDPYPRQMLVECLVRTASSTTRLARPKAKEEILREADGHVAESLRLDPSSAVPHLLQAKVALTRNHIVPARTAVMRGLEIEPNNPVGHQLLGIIAEVTGNVGKAGDHYVDAARLNPRSSTSIQRLRSLGRFSLPISGIGAYILLRVLLYGGRHLEGAVARLFVLALFGGAAALVVALTYGARWQARRELSPEARRALDLDRTLRGRRREVLRAGATIAAVTVLVGLGFVVDLGDDDDEAARPRGVVPQDVLDAVELLPRPATDPVTGAAGFFTGAVFIPWCDALPGHPVEEGGLGTNGCGGPPDATRAYEVVAMRRETCPEGQVVYLAGRGTEQYLGIVGGTWAVLDGPVCSG